jgi:hypothetical protein
MDLSGDIRRRVWGDVLRRVETPQVIGLFGCQFPSQHHKPGDTVAIVGGGPIGLATLLTAAFQRKTSTPEFHKH